MKNFTLKLKDIRKSKGISQIELSNMLEIKQQTISDFEREKSSPSLEMAVKIAQVLEVSLDQLIEFKEIHNKTSKEYINMMNEDQDE